MTPESKSALSATIRKLRERLLADLHATAEAEYRLGVAARQAGLDEARRQRRARLEDWLDEQARAEARNSGARERGAFLRELEQRAAYTLLNRLVLLRLMEGMGLRRERVLTGGWNSPGYQAFREIAPALVRDDPSEGYAYLLRLLFEDLALELPGLFGPAGHADLIPVGAATLRHLVEALDAPELASCWTDDMTLGWVYQYWNDPEREALDAKLNAGGKVAPHEIASKTQMFTERYMVDWLLQNSLGPLWLAMCRKHRWTADCERRLPDEPEPETPADADVGWNKRSGSTTAPTGGSVAPLLDPPYNAEPAPVAPHGGPVAPLLGPPYTADADADADAVGRNKRSGSAEAGPEDPQPDTTPPPTGLLRVLDERRADWRAKRDASAVSLTELMPLHSDAERRWAYYVPQPVPADAIGQAPSSIRDLRLLDPAVGSGHFLVVAFDLLFALYQEEARHRGETDDPCWSDAAIVERILGHNLHGIDLDPRAVQIAAAALRLKAKRTCPEARPERVNLVASNLRLAGLGDDDPAVLELRREVERETGIPAALTDTLLQALAGADHLGSLLQIDQAVEEAIERHESELTRVEPKQLNLMFDPDTAETPVSVSGSVSESESQSESESGELEPRRTGKATPAHQADNDATEPMGTPRFAHPPQPGPSEGDRPKDREQTKADVLERLEAFLARHTGGEDLGLRLHGEQLAAGVRFLRMLKPGRYDLVVGNPPYQGTSKMVDVDYVKRRYPLGKADLYAAFLLRGLELVREGGTSALLTMRNWMFIKQYAELRGWLLETYDLRALGDFAIGAFDAQRQTMLPRRELFD